MLLQKFLMGFSDLVSPFAHYKISCNILVSNNVISNKFITRWGFLL